MEKYKIIAVGDLHGDWGSINSLIQKKKPDMILQCGDFGWWPIAEVNVPIMYSTKKRWKLKGIKPHETKVYFCDGNHEQFSELPQNGIRELYKNVFHVGRGNTITLPDGRVVLFIGGASSVDKGNRTAGVDWFPEEDIKMSEFDLALSHERVDIIISHTCPIEFEPIKGFIHHGNMSIKYKDVNRFALGTILRKYEPKKWFFGHWHTFATGTYKRTNWTCLDYPKHLNRWWIPVK
jgi:Icc-related predicted phosphoesterase